MEAMLEVVALHPADAEAAQAGGADRIYFAAGLPGGGTSPAPSDVRELVRSCDLPVRVLLRLNDGDSTTGGELSRLVGLGSDFLAAGAEGVAFGFLDADLDIDVQVCTALADALAGVPWTFHRTVDRVLDVDGAWRTLLQLPGLDTVLTAGSSLDVAHGQDELCRRAAADPRVSALVMAGGGLLAEQVPWLLRAGIHKFHLGSAVRPGGSWERAYADADYVRSWRTLLDDHLARITSA